jgi:CheY-like chemotaxis protein
VKAKAFDPFFTTMDVGHGTGLGLSQVYGFVKQSRGHVKIYSEVGEGTTVKIYLPRVHSVTPVEQEETDQAIDAGLRSRDRPRVEDDADVRSYSCETLRELGYNVLEAETARSALQVLDTRPEIRVLFTDVGLPGGMNGRQLVEEARKRRPDLRLLFTTGYARNAIVHDGRLDSGVELITKPFSQAALAGKLRDIIDSARTPGRVLLVEDEALIQMMATDCSR